MGVKVMQEMFEASVDGQPYDADLVQYSRPVWRLELVIPNVAPSPNATAVSQSAPAETAPPATTVLAETAPTPMADTPAEGNASDILAMIPSQGRTH